MSFFLFLVIIVFFLILARMTLFAYGGLSSIVHCRGCGLSQP